MYKWNESNLHLPVFKSTRKFLNQENPTVTPDITETVIITYISQLVCFFPPTKMLCGGREKQCLTSTFIACRNTKETEEDEPHKHIPWAVLHLCLPKDNSEQMPLKEVDWF